MKLYLVRHGQTDWNLQNKAQGHADIPLNQTGLIEAKNLRDNLSTYQFDVCYVSPLQRARQTAELVLENRQVPIRIDPIMLERDFGSLQGTDPKTWQIPNAFDRRINTGEGGIEPIKTLLERTRTFLEHLRAENSENARILIVGHGTWLKCLYFVITGYDDDTDFLSFHLEKWRNR